MNFDLQDFVRNAVVILSEKLPTASIDMNAEPIKFGRSIDGKVGRQIHWDIALPIDDVPKRLSDWADQIVAMTPRTFGLLILPKFGYAVRETHGGVSVRGIIDKKIDGGEVLRLDVIFV